MTICTQEAHEAMKRDEAAWQALECIGEQFGLELRNCQCGSTLGRPGPDYVEEDEECAA